MITPTPFTAFLAGAVAGSLMPLIWTRAGDDSLGFAAAFLLVVALPAHAFVVGFKRTAAEAGKLDTALLKRVAVWLGAAVLSSVVAQFVSA